MAVVDVNDVGFKDFAQTFHKEYVEAYTPLEDYKSTLRSVGQMSAEEIAAVDVNDVGFKSYARVFNKEAHKELMVNAEQAAESAATTSESVGTASEAATQAAAEVAQEVAEVAQVAAEEAAEQISKSSDEIFSELAEINDAFFTEARATGMTISEYMQTEGGKANEEAAKQKRKELGEALSKGN